MSRKGDRAELWSAVIVDDEQPARRRLENLLAREGDVAVVGSTDDPEDALSLIAAQRPDLLFVDVQMPRVTGIDLVRMIPAESLPLVVFVTAYDEYAVSAFDLNAVDSVLKPVDAERFHVAVERAKRRPGLETAEQNSGLRRLLDSTTPAGADRIVVESNQRMRLLRVDEIEWIQAAGNYVRLRAGGREHTLRESIGVLEQRLDSRRFVRIHRSTIVNIDFIHELVPRAFGDYLVYMRGGTELVMSRRYRARLAPPLRKL